VAENFERVEEKGRKKEVLPPSGFRRKREQAGKVRSSAGQGKKGGKGRFL